MKNKEKPTIGEFIWLFVFGCLLGFMLETVWYYVKNGILINKQGLLYGPFKPIYGIGLVLIVLFMYKLQDEKFGKKFIFGVLIGSAFEYICSVFQEYVFGTSTRNYANFNFNIAGRLYLPYCLAWGFIAVICIDFIYPKFKRLFRKIPQRVGKILTVLISIFMVINISLTTLATIRYSDRTNLRERNSRVFRVIDKMYPDDYMKFKFPKLKIIKK